MERFTFKLDRTLPEDWEKYNPSYGRYWETIYNIISVSKNSKGEDLIYYTEEQNMQNYGYTQEQFIKRC